MSVIATRQQSSSKKDSRQAGDDLQLSYVCSSDLLYILQLPNKTSQSIGTHAPHGLITGRFADCGLGSLPVRQSHLLTEFVLPSLIPGSSTDGSRK